MMGDVLADGPGVCKKDKRVSRPQAAKFLGRSLPTIVRRQANDPKFPKAERDEVGRYHFWLSELQRYQDERFKRSA
jgi:predicted DNA-binding transcriptional regulator AlpA